MNRSTITKGLAVVVSAVVLVSLVCAVSVLESPMKRRQYRLDDLRVQNIDRIHWSINRYAREHKKLPQDMAALESADEAGERQPTDPITHLPYEYIVLDAESYQLCAVFTLPSPDEGTRTYAAGKQCFKYTRDQ